jgi:hypothetical protein
MLARTMLAMAGLVSIASPALAADHAEAPGTQADPAADIADFYAWSDGGTVTAILTYNPLMIAGDPAVYDADVLYSIHFDVDGDAVSDHDIHVRFGQNAEGHWGVQAMGVPGAGAPVQGPVESVVAGPGSMLYAGLRDDPFFFDMDGFNDTVASGTLSFTGADAIAGYNVMVIAVTFDAPSLLGSDSDFQTWATTSRI